MIKEILHMIIFVMAIAVLAIMAIFVTTGMNLDECVEYELPDYLEPRTDGDCAAIGILLRKATATKKCVTVVNDWWRGENPISRHMAEELAKGY